MTAAKAGPREIRQLVLLDASLRELVHRERVHLAFQLFVTAVQDALVEPRLKRSPFLERQAVGRHVRRCQCDGLSQRRTPKFERLPGNADERDRAKFAKAASYMVLLDDKTMCKNMRCRKRFDISGIKTTAFL